MRNLLLKKQTLLFLAVIFLGACGRPVAKFSYDVKKVEAPAKVVFDNQSEKSESYFWDFGDGNTSTEAQPQHQYLFSGNYTVKLKAIKGEKSKTVEKKVSIDAPEECLVLIETDFGNMVAILYDATPLHRDNFIKLAEEEFYDDLLFHRVITGFMIQGGDPNSRDAKPNQPLGNGGPGYQIPAEFVDTLVHVKGALAAARLGGPINPEKKSSGSQFYIVQGRKLNDSQIALIEAQKNKYYTPDQKEKLKKLGGTPHLDNEYTVFGQIISGLDVIDKIAETETLPGDRPVKDLKMKIRVIK